MKWKLFMQIVVPAKEHVGNARTTIGFPCLVQERPLKDETEKFEVQEEITIMMGQIKDFVPRKDKNG